MCIESVVCPCMAGLLPVCDMVYAFVVDVVSQVKEQAHMYAGRLIITHNSHCI